MTRQQQLKIPAIVAGLLDKPYELGKSDCITLLMNFYKGIGISIPQEFNGTTLETYADKWAVGECRDDYMEYLNSFTEDIDEEAIQPGDILIIKGAELDFFGIYLGSGNFITCLEDFGTRVMPMRFFKIIETRRVGIAHQEIGTVPDLLSGTGFQPVETGKMPVPPESQGEV